MIRPRLCPICHKPLSVDASQSSKTYPFCSERCRQVDLFRWCDGKYAIVEPLTPELLQQDDGELLDRADDSASLG